jgi:hemolysin III
LKLVLSKKRRIKMNRFRDPASGFSHLLGAVLAVVGLVFLLHSAISNRNIWQIVSFSIFGASAILLYSTSATYHLVKASEKVITTLRKLDHMMIFVLIAGTYTPICLVLLRGKIGYTVLITLWSMTLLGIFFKIFFINAPRWLYTSIYLIMGWFAVFIIVPIYKVSGFNTIIWLGIGGIFYTIGGVIYGLKKPNLIPKWLGFHEIFHIFIILGTLSHFLMIYKFVN